MAGLSITVTAESAAAAGLVRDILLAMGFSPAEGVSGVHLSVDNEADTWWLTDHAGGARRKPRKPGDLVYHLTDRIIHHIADGATGHHCLHAAAVSREGRALIMPAASGSGKSLLTAWLVANGFDYISDELILVDENYGISGVSRPLQIKRAGLPVISGLIASEAGPLAGTRASAVPVAQLGGRISTHRSHELGLVLFPRFEPEAEFALSPLEPAEAGMKFMSNHINARNLQGHGFSSLMEMVRNARCFDLAYSDFNEFPSGFAGDLAGLLSGSGN